MIGTWRQLEAQRTYQDHTDLLEKFDQEGLSAAIEIATTVKITQDVLDAFSNADFTGTGTADWEDEHLRIGLPAALKALGFEVVQ